jgi:hypothetical protein
MGAIEKIDEVNMEKWFTFLNAFICLCPSFGRTILSKWPCATAFSAYFSGLERNL